MILSGKKIQQEIEDGHIRIDPFNPEHINPVSYDLTLGDRVAVYVNDDQSREWGHCDTETMVLRHYLPERLDAAKENHIGWNTVAPGRGVTLCPGIGYLMHTRERVWTDRYCAIVDGKSSIGRLFVTIHCTAGFIDPGFDGQVTLEVHVVHPVRLYPGMRIAQIRYHHIDGEVELYRGHYTGENAMGAVASRSWKQMEEQKR